jgi:hypothetical protein
MKLIVALMWLLCAFGLAGWVALMGEALGAWRLPI